MPKFLLWKLILLKLSDVNKQFLWGNSAKKNRWIAPSGPEWFRGGHCPGNHGWWCVDPNFKISLQIAPQRVQINILVGLACGMWPFMWRTAIPVNNVLKKEEHRSRWMCRVCQFLCVQEFFSEFLHPCSWIVKLSCCYFLVIYQIF